LALAKKDTCGPHVGARLAKALNISQTATGRGGKRCIDCGRLFKAEDWVWKSLRPRSKVKKPGDAYGHAHVCCEPPTPRLSKKAIRVSVKPLLEATDDVTRDRGAA
jgi:hypothetical protein